MSQGQQPVREGEERYASLLNNSNAVRAVTSAVEGTLGPKGLDVMLVGDRGEVIITNDGVTILDKMDVSHPAARLLIQVARSQQQKVGDGTTTATVLAGALVQEGVAQIVKGVPASKVVARHAAGRPHGGRFPPEQGEGDRRPGRSFARQSRLCCRAGNGRRSSRLSWKQPGSSGCAS